jgi:hypothetical protein
LAFCRVDLDAAAHVAILARHPDSTHTDATSPLIRAYASLRAARSAPPDSRRRCTRERGGKSADVAYVLVAYRVRGSGCGGERAQRERIVQRLSLAGTRADVSS